VSCIGRTGDKNWQSCSPTFVDESITRDDVRSQTVLVKATQSRLWPIFCGEYRRAKEWSRFSARISFVQELLNWHDNHHQVPY
jgi:hypothetical protein